MLRIYFYFLRRYLPYFAMITAGEYALLFVIDRLGFDTITFQVIVGWAAPFVVAVIGTLALPRNLSWLTGLPVRKRELIAANFLMNVSSQALSLGGAVAVISGFNLSRRGVETVSAAVATTELGLRSSLAGEGVYRALVLFVLVDLFLLFNLTFFRSTARGMQFSWQGWRRPRTQLIAMGLAPVALIAIALLRPFVDNAFFYFTGAMLMAATLVPWSIGHAVGLGFPARKRMMAVALAVVAVQIASLYTIAARNIASGDRQSVAKGLTFLGPFGGRVSAAELGGILASDIDATEFRALAERYRALFNGGKPLDASRSELRIADVARLKSRPERLFALGELFDWSTVPAREIPRLLDRAVAVRDGENIDIFAANFLGARFSSVQLAELVESRNDLANFLGLVATRYSSDRTLASVIRRQLRGYDDARKVTALLTLSILERHRYGIADLNELAASGGVRSLAAVAACDSLAHRTFAELGHADPGQLNACLRHRAREQGVSPARITELESGGWYASPFSREQRRVLKRVLGAR